MSKEDIYILGIESSCDDTAAAILITIIAIVMLMEYLSGHIRAWIQ